MDDSAAKAARTPLMFTIGGLGASRGFASGAVYIYRGEDDFAVPECVVGPEEVPAELERFREAHRATRADLERLLEELRARGGDGVQVMENHLVMLDDPVLVSSIEQLIRDERLNTALAVRRAVGKYRDLFAGMDDPYLKERVRDLDDVERRFFRVLFDRPNTALSDIRSPVILVADDLTPSETISLPRAYVLGFATGAGSVTSHVALLARSLGIPAVTGLGADITSRVTAGDVVLLDGTNGSLTVNPDAGTIREFESFAGRARELFRLVDECRDLPCVTRDGHEVVLRANAHPGMPLSSALGFGADGVGLYRSEYLWLSRAAEPTEDEQFEIYAEAVRSAAGRPVTIRVLDLGGDKLVDGMDTAEDNPFLGNRSIRYLLSHRETFRTQLRAILRASAFGRVQIMYPLVATVEELKAANAELAGEMGRLRLAGVPFDSDIRRGVMIEVPAAALNAAEFAKEADFFSIGTNDLVQYTMAADRGNDAVAYLYQPTCPAVLRLVEMTVAAASAAGIPVAVCGESASDPVLALLWTGMGVTELSMSASYVPAIKKTLRSVVYAELQALVREIMGAAGLSAAAIYARCREFLLSKAPEFAEIQTFFMHDGLTV